MSAGGGFEECAGERESGRVWSSVGGLEGRLLRYLIPKAVLGKRNASMSEVSCCSPRRASIASGVRGPTVRFWSEGSVPGTVEIVVGEYVTIVRSVFGVVDRAGGDGEGQREVFMSRV